MGLRVPFLPRPVRARQESEPHGVDSHRGPAQAARVYPDRVKRNVGSSGPLRLGRALAALALLSIGTAVAAPEPDPAASAYAPRATAFLAAAQKIGEERALDGLQAADEDPWIVAEELLLLGEDDAARRVSNAGWSADDAALKDYVERGRPGTQALALALERARSKLAAKDAKGALALLPEGSPSGLTVTAVRVLALRAAAHDLDENPDAARQVRSGLARRAAAIGWRRAEVEAQSALLAGLEGARKPASVRRVLSRLLALDHDARDLTRSATWCLRLGKLELESQNHRMSRRWLIEAESLLGVLARSRGLPPALLSARARGLQRLAEVHRALGNLAASVDTAFRAHDMAESLEPAVRAHTARTLGYALSGLARLEEAEAYLREAVRLTEKGSAQLRARLRGDLAFLLLRRGKREEAKQLYDEVLKSAEIQRDPRTRYVARLHVAAAWIDHPSGEHRVPDLQRALLDLFAILQELEDEPATFAARAEIEANAKTLAGRALNLLERPGEAEPLLREVLAGDYARGLPGIRQYVWRELAHAVRREGDVKEALALTRRAVQNLQQNVESLPASYALSVLSPPSVGELIAAHIDCAQAAGSPQELLTALEETRGMAFLSEVRRRRRRGARLADSDQPRVMATLAADVADAAQTYWRARARGRRADVRKAKKTLWEQRVRLRTIQGREALREARSKPGPAPGTAPVVFRQVKALQADEAMLYVTLSGTSYLAVLEVAGRLHVESLGTRAELEPLLEEARETWLDSEAKAHAAALARMVNAVLPGRLCAQLVAKQVPPHVDVTHVYVAASGPTAQLPWPVLLAEACKAAGRPAEKLPTVSLVASQGVLNHLRTWNRPRAGGAVLAIGDPDYSGKDATPTRRAIFGPPLTRLPNSGVEARAIVDEERGDLVLLGADANEAMLRRCLFDAPYPFEILHLSCHGLLYGATPWLSALALHATPDEDGLLTVDEVGHWHFQGGPRLVVLAACESGLGAPVPGEGEEGLVRAFLLAGARHVVASLWKVPDDSSRKVMVAFHRYLRDASIRPADALRRAQADFRRQAKGGEAHPYAWAGWAVWGPKD